LEKKKKQTRKNTDSQLFSEHLKFHLLLEVSFGDTHGPGQPALADPSVVEVGLQSPDIP